MAIFLSLIGIICRKYHLQILSNQSIYYYYCKSEYLCYQSHYHYQSYKQMKKKCSNAVTFSSYVCACLSLPFLLHHFKSPTWVLDLVFLLIYCHNFFRISFAINRDMFCSSLNNFTICVLTLLRVAL